MSGNDAMVMGDLVLTQPEMNPVMTKLIENGIESPRFTITFYALIPATMYMHVLGHGDPVKLATALHAALQESRTPLRGALGASPAADIARSIHRDRHRPSGIRAK